MKRIILTQDEIIDGRLRREGEILVVPDDYPANSYEVDAQIPDPQEVNNGTTK